MKNKFDRGSKNRLLNLGSNKPLANEKLLFIALYFFILIFFILLTYSAFSPQGANNITRLFPSLDSQEKSSNNSSITAEYYSEKLKTYLPLETSTFSQTSDSIFNHLFTWEEVYDKERNINKEFIEFLEKRFGNNNYSIDLDVHFNNQSSHLEIATILALIASKKCFKIRVISSTQSIIFFNITNI